MPLQRLSGVVNGILTCAFVAESNLGEKHVRSTDYE